MKVFPFLYEFVSQKKIISKLFKTNSVPCLKKVLLDNKKFEPTLWCKV